LDYLARGTSIDSASQHRNDFGYLDAKIAGKTGLRAKEISGHRKSGIPNVLKYNRLRLKALEYPGNLVDPRDRLSDMLQTTLLFQKSQMMAKSHRLLHSMDELNDLVPFIFHTQPEYTREIIEAVKTSEWRDLAHATHIEKERGISYPVFTLILRVRAAPDFDR
jgi:hypothetical protein